MLTGYFDKNGNEIRVGDNWEFLNVVYKVVREGDRMHFAHPSPWASRGDNIEIEHSKEGVIAAK